MQDGYEEVGRVTHGDEELVITAFQETDDDNDHYSRAVWVQHGDDLTDRLGLAGWDMDDVDERVIAPVYAYTHDFAIARQVRDIIDHFILNNQ